MKSEGMALDGKVADCVFRDRDGWHCVVDGEVYGIWPCREYAIAGMKTEQRRAKAREERMAALVDLPDGE